MTIESRTAELVYALDVPTRYGDLQKFIQDFGELSQSQGGLEVLKRNPRIKEALGCLDAHVYFLSEPKLALTPDSPLASNVQHEAQIAMELARMTAKLATAPETSASHASGWRISEMLSSAVANFRLWPTRTPPVQPS